MRAKTSRSSEPDKTAALGCLYQEVRRVIECAAHSTRLLVVAAACAAISLVAGCAVEIPKTVLPGIQANPASGPDPHDKAQDQHFASLSPLAGV